MTGLYIHVPVCVSQCSYCDFYRLTAPGRATEQLFVEALAIELERLPKAFAPDTVFIGGGTPTALEPDLFEAMLESVTRSINLSNVIEYTIEANPGSLSPERLALMQSAGINRVSIGVQSFNDEVLKLLRRGHRSAQAIRSYHRLREAGVDNVSIDLIQGIPGMSEQDVLADAQMAAELAPEHISYYNLIYEPNTPLTRDRDAGRIVPVEEDVEADQFFSVKRLLESVDYAHYEISNFCRPGRASRHNTLYWRNEEYFGVGPSAHSHWAGARFGNVRDLSAYAERLKKGARPFDALERLEPAAKAREALVMELRLLKGVDLAEFFRRTGFEVEALCGESVAELVRDGLLIREGDFLRLTEEALFVSNYVFSELV